MKRVWFYSIVSAAVAVFLGGCSEPHRPPPLERMELTARFFRNVQENHSGQAIRQAKKLMLLDPDANYLVSLVSLQEANDTIREAQNAIEKGNINRALNLIREGRKKHLNNRTFSQIYPKVSQLRNAEKLFRALTRAKNSSSMRGARIAVRSGLSLNITPELEKYLSDYELRGAAVAAREKARIVAAERAAREAALRAKEEERRRRVQEKKFARETAEKTAEGERLRQEHTFPDVKK